MQKILTILFLSLSIKTIAQIPEDAIRYSWFTQNGTARSLAIGGAVGSLGGDLNANFVNPAGIGFYKTNEATITAGLNMGKIKTNYLNTQLDSKQNNFKLGTSGFVLAVPNWDNSTRTTSFSIALNQQVNFNNNIHYSGYNKYSSFSETFAEELAKKNIVDVLSTQSTAPYTAAPAYLSYLIYFKTPPGGQKIVESVTDSILYKGRALQQDINKTTKGGMYELAGSYAMNDGDKWVVGIGVGVPITNFESNTEITETDTSNIKTDGFKSFKYTDNYTTKGLGINAKIGVIYRPRAYIRLGLAIHTPTYSSMIDERKSSLATVLENPFKDTLVKSSTFTNGQERGSAKYDQNGPWKVILSGSYVFREVEDVTKQRGFISADIEYVKHNGTKFSSNAEQPTEDDKDYYKQLSGVVKEIYKGNINVRVGGEVKFNTIMGRLGFGYYGSPYKDAPTSANKMILSGGLGYRNKGFFIDLTYAHQITKDFDVPYRLQNTETLYAGIKQQAGNVVATVGVKF